VEGGGWRVEGVWWRVEGWEVGGGDEGGGGKHWRNFFQDLPAWVKRIAREKIETPLTSADPETIATTVDFLSKMLTFEPNLRSTASELLRHPFLASVNHQPTVEILAEKGMDFADINLILYSLDCGGP
jgi:serine/threonine protein kinase